MHLFEKRERFSMRGVLISAVLFIALGAVFALMLGEVETRSDAQQTQVLEDAIRQASVTCYAIEGRYPPSVRYILEHYGVVVDEEKYIVSYSGFASNIMPSINVLLKGEAVP